MKKEISNFLQVASVRRYTINEGIANGLKVIDCDNGKIRFLLNESNALDIMQIYHRGENISFISKNGFNTNGFLPFASRFEGGMLYTCGLDSIGAREGYELHGSHHHSPAIITRIECNEEGIFIEGEIREAALFGKNLLMKRKIYSKIHSDVVEIKDSIINCGYQEEKYCLLYHVNLGYPFLQEGNTIEGSILDVQARTPWAEQNLADYRKITEPLPGQEEMCYFLKFDEPKVKVINPNIHKAFELTWSKETLPSFVEWKSMAANDFALGLEPCTSELDDRFHYEILKPGEIVNTSLTLSISSF